MRGKSPHTNCRGGARRLAAVEGGLMEGSITARTLDYFALLVGASIVALCSGVVATLCVKYELRGQTDSLTLRRMAVARMTGNVPSKGC